MSWIIFLVVVAIMQSSTATAAWLTDTEVREQLKSSSQQSSQVFSPNDTAQTVAEQYLNAVGDKKLSKELVKQEAKRLGTEAARDQAYRQGRIINLREVEQAVDSAIEAKQTASPKN